jgi:hypothetical protein
MSPDLGDYRTYRLWIAGIGVVVASFFFTLWLTAPQDKTDQIEKPSPATPMAIFASFQVSDQAQLAAAAKSAQLKKSDTLKGVVEELSPSGKGRASMRGWAADKIGSGGVITVLVFAHGRQIYEVQTKGTRSDVIDSLKLTAAAGANVQFDGVFSCNPGHPLMFVAVETDTYYAQLAGPTMCPS